MKIIQTIKDSIYNPEFYKTEKDGSFKSALLYFSKITLIEALVITLAFSLILIPLTQKLLSDTTTNKIIEAFPADLVVTVKNGMASTNVTEPYMVPFSKESREFAEKNPEVYKNNPLPENGLIIDTKSPLNLDLVTSNKTSSLLTKEYLVVKNNTGKITVQPLKTFPNMELSKTKIAGWIESAKPYFKFAIPFLTLISFFIVLGISLVTSLILIATMSFVIWIVLKIQKRPMSYKQIFKLGFYVITSVILLNILLAVAGSGAIWILSVAVFLVIFFINNKKENTVVAL